MDFVRFANMTVENIFDQNFKDGFFANATFENKTLY